MLSVVVLNVFASVLCRLPTLTFAQKAEPDIKITCSTWVGSSLAWIVRIGWKLLSVTNALAYNAALFYKVVKFYILQALSVNAIKLLHSLCHCWCGEISYSVWPQQTHSGYSNICEYGSDLSTFKVLHSGRLWPRIQILDLPEKLVVTNATAYFDSHSVTKKKSFMTLTPRANPINFLQQ